MPEAFHVAVNRLRQMLIHWHNRWCRPWMIPYAWAMVVIAWVVNVLAAVAALRGA